MNFLRRLFGAPTPKESDPRGDLAARAATRQAREAEEVRAAAGDALIMHADVIPGKLAVRVYRHTIESRSGPLEVWTYLSAGLERLGHRELRMTFPRVERPNGCYIEPLDLMRQIHEAAEQGSSVGPFGQTWFGQDWMGFRRIVYVDATGLAPFAGVNTPPGTLHAVFLKEHEGAEVERVGCALRQLVRLGGHYRHYPWPTWNDPARPDLGPASGSARSILDGAGWLPAWECGVVGDGTAVTLRVPRAEGRRISARLATLPPGSSCTLSLGLDAGSHGCHVWFPGQSGAAAITPEQLMPAEGTSVAPRNMRIAGCFVAFAPGADWSGAAQVEDGFAVVLTDLDWRRVRDAMESGGEATVEPTLPDRLPFVVRPAEEVYLNPVDGQEYHARWSEHSPVGGPRRSDLPPGVSVSWRLLTSETDIAGRTSVDDLVAFGQQAEAAMSRLLSGSGCCGELTIQFDCEAEGFSVRTAHRGSFSSAMLRMLESQLASLEPLRPTGPVSFQLEATFQEPPPAG